MKLDEIKKSAFTAESLRSIEKIANDIVDGFNLQSYKIHVVVALADGGFVLGLKRLAAPADSNQTKPDRSFSKVAVAVKDELLKQFPDLHFHDNSLETGYRRFFFLNK